MVHGDATVAVHTRPLSREETLWRAVWEVGPDVAALDGVTALHVAGLRATTTTAIHCSVVHTAR